MFGSRVLVAIVIVIVLLALALGAAGPTRGGASDVRYVVKPGDTLWEVAAEHMAGDPREGVWRIGERNGLETPTLVPGQVLYIPR